MGKRSTIVVSSSDDEDKVFALSSSSSYKPKSKSTSSSVPRANPKRQKRSRLSNSCSRPYKEHDGFEEMNLFCEDFYEGFNGFKVSADSRRISKDLWVDKHKPRSLEELAVHKKKVEEVKVWFEERLRIAEEIFCNNVLLITGQAGVGKSATVHVIASHLGATVCEWNTPTPTIWQEHLHNSKSGIRYTSKLDEFENFVEKIRKYGLFPPSFTGGSKKSTVLLIDDLPVVNGKVAYSRLHRCLHLLVQSIHIPTAILITDYDKTDSADYTTRCWEELQSSLQSAGTCKVGFNPITANSIKKTLTRICREEQFKVNLEQIDSIAKASGGDIRHAITSLQYFCLKPQPMRDRSYGCSQLDDGFSLRFGRDETLSLFHALGKFLHNKRETERTISSYEDAIVLQDRFVRLPLKMDEPEKVLCQTHGQARPIADFLHENVLDFMNEEAIENAWIVSTYLSDADCLLASLGGLITRNYEAENIVQSAAASVAVRGVLFGNTQPLSSRWHAIRRPKLWQVDQSLWRNKSEMVRERSIAYNSFNLPDLAITATEYRPILKWLGFRAYEDSEARKVSMEGEDDNSDGMNLDGQINDITDDEIEDW